MGRPRAFDEGAVLDRATDVFWRYGYEGASLSDLTAAMGINSPSLYAAFGSKRGLFDAVVARYDARRDAHRRAVQEAPTARAAAGRMLYGAIDWLTCPREPLGCLLIQAGLSASSDNADVPEALARQRGRLVELLRARFAQAQMDGDLAADADPCKLARYINLVFIGLAVQAAAGSPRRALCEVATFALSGWPLTTPSEDLA